MTTPPLVIHFRCARTGKRFASVFSRHSPAHRYQFQENREPAPGEVSARSHGSSVARTAQQLGRLGLQKLLGLGERVKEVRAALTSGSTTLVRSGPEASLETSSRGAGARLVPESFDVKDVDLSGWSCPHCGHGKHILSAHSFVHCGKCDEYICASRVRQVDGATLFACHDGCGRTGEVQGELSSFRGATVAAPSAGQLKGEGPKQLPSPRSTLTKK